MAACVLMVASPVMAQETPPRSARPGVKKQEELRHVVARRIRQQTGVPVRIGDLVYNVFNSTFLGKKIAAGPPRRPFLRLEKVKLKMELMADRPGTTVANVEATGARARVAVKYLGRPLMRAYQMLTVKRGLISGPRVAVVGPRGPQISCKGFHFSVANLVVPPGRSPQMSGEVWLTIRSMAVGGHLISGLALKGKLRGASVIISRVTASFMGGPITLSGTVELGGAVDLTGDVALRPWGANGPPLTGKVSIKGPSPHRLTLSGSLTTRKPLRRHRGALRSAPEIKLRVRIGKRRLGGTLKRWRIR